MNLLINNMNISSTKNGPTYWLIAILKYLLINILSFPVANNNSQGRRERLERVS